HLISDDSDTAYPCINDPISCISMIVITRSKVPPNTSIICLIVYEFRSRLIRNVSTFSTHNDCRCSVCEFDRKIGIDNVFRKSTTFTPSRYLHRVSRGNRNPREWLGTVTVYEIVNYPPIQSFFFNPERVWDINLVNGVHPTI